MSVPPAIQPGDLVNLYVDRNKSQAHDRYLATGVDGLWCNIKKFKVTQLRRTSYRVRLSNCYRVGGPNTASTSHNDNLESDEDVNIPDDCPALHCPDVPPATAEPPPTPCPHDGEVCGEPLCVEPLLAAPQPAVEEYLDPASVPRTWLRVLLARSLDRQASASCSFPFGGLYSV